MLARVLDPVELQYRKGGVVCAVSVLYSLDFGSKSAVLPNPPADPVALFIFE